jgi:hypothetical protein
MARTLMKLCAHACVRGCAVLGRFGWVFLFFSIPLRPGVAGNVSQFEMPLPV